MNSDCIVFCALKLSIKKLVRLIFLLKIPFYFNKREQKEGLKRKGCWGGWVLSIKICLLQNTLKIKKERGRYLSPFDRMLLLPSSS